MALAGKRAQIKVSGVAVVFTDETTSTTDDISYQIDDVLKRVWCRTCTIVVEDGGVPTVEDYVINRLTGTVTFEVVDATRVITVTGEYLPMSVAAECFDYSYTIDASNQDSTEFGDEYIDRTQGLLDFSGSLSKFYNISNFFVDELLSGTPFVVEFFSNSSVSADIKAWVLIASDDISASVDGLVEEGIDIEGTNDADGRAVSIT